MNKSSYAYGEPVVATAVPADYGRSQPIQAVPHFSGQQAYNEPVHSGVNEPAIRDYLSTNKWPIGLQETFISNAKQIAMRFIICDDSGSMSEVDGHLPLAPKNSPACTRWEELTDSLRFMLQAAKAADIPTEFRLLNAVQPIRVGADNDPDNVGFNMLMTVFNEQPRGQTPLCHHIKAIVETVRGMESQLRESRQRACVVICTDGVSSDGDLIQAMKPLERLPVWIVIKLCTDDDNIVEYWNNIDRMLEVEIDVLDDYISEAAEVYAANPWLTYGLQLHRMREFGLPSKEFDILDSSLLSPGQMRSLVSALLGGKPHDYPEPTQNFADFTAAVQNRMQHSVNTKDPNRGLREVPWIDIRMLKKKYGPKSGCQLS